MRRSVFIPDDQSNPDDLKAGFERYGNGRIPRDYVPEKIDIKVPGGMFAKIKVAR